MLFVPLSIFCCLLTTLFLPAFLISCFFSFHLACLFLSPPAFLILCPLHLTNNIPHLYYSNPSSTCPLLCCIYPSTSFPFLLCLFLPSLLLFSPTPKVSWLRKDGELSESRTTKDFFDRRLRFSNISESDAGEYQCIAENPQGKATHTYTVTVEGTSHTLMHIYTVCYIAFEIRMI